MRFAELTVGVRLDAIAQRPVAAFGEHEVEVAVGIEIADTHVGRGFGRVFKRQRLRERSSGNLLACGRGKDMQAPAARYTRRQHGLRHRLHVGPTLYDPDYSGERASVGLTDPPGR